MPDALQNAANFVYSEWVMWTKSCSWTWKLSSINKALDSHSWTWKPHSWVTCIKAPDIYIAGTCCLAASMIPWQSPRLTRLRRYRHRIRKDRWSLCCAGQGRWTQSAIADAQSRKHHTQSADLPCARILTPPLISPVTFWRLRGWGSWRWWRTFSSLSPRTPPKSLLEHRMEGILQPGGRLRPTLPTRCSMNRSGRCGKVMIAFDSELLDFASRQLRPSFGTT